MRVSQTPNLSIACEVGLFNVYMGNDKAWGVDNAFYYWSTWIIYALASLPEKIFQIVIEDEGLPIKNFFFDIPEKFPIELYFHFVSFIYTFRRCTVVPYRYKVNFSFLNASS